MARPIRNCSIAPWNAPDRKLSHLTKRNLLQLLVCVAAIVMACGAFAQPSPQPPGIGASAAILVDADSGEVLYEHNADARRPPASTTKIMTGILLIENLPLDTVVEADKTSSETDGSSLYMKPGERISAEDLLYAIMLRSANDACVAVARAIGGSPEGFVALMNRKATEIGAVNTHFANPNGLHAPDHYTTARDLALIACYAMRNPTFRQVVGTRYRIIKRDPQNKDVYLKNHAKFLWWYPGADGIKTGYTTQAGRCFVGSATRNGWRLISVVLNSPDMYAETRALMDYGFGAFTPMLLMKAETRAADVPIANGHSRTVAAIVSRDLRYVAPSYITAPPQVKVRTLPLKAPVRKGAVVGYAEAFVGSTVVARTELHAAADVMAPPPPVVPKHGQGWRIVGTIAAIGIFWYGSARSETSRRRRHCLETGLRGVDALGASNGERSARDDAGRQG